MNTRAKRFRTVLAAVTMAAVIVTTLGGASAGVLAQAKKPAAKKPAPAKPTAKTPAAPVTPYNKGYQGGYGEGYKQGTGDWQQGVPRDFRRTDVYTRREQLYDEKMAELEEYTAGFDLGLEMGYNDGYYGRTRNLEVPANGIVLAKAAALADAQRAREREQRARNRDSQNRDFGRDSGNRDSQNRDSQNRDFGRDPGNRDAQTRDRRVGNQVSLNIPNNTQLRLRLTSQIDTKTSRVGDLFTAEVLSPESYQGARVEGHIATLNKSGRVSGRTELGLAFDTITLEDGRSGRLDAQLESIIESDKVKKVDEEGTVESGSRTRDSQVRGGIGAAAGAIIGGIVGGAKGAIVGLILGGAAGVGTVYVEGNKDLLLEPGTEMTILTARSGAR